ncbi:hypothetical protein DY000_02022694 [Brassica cretica]|uniref:Uncharacterized protein n=1 Tax=Brassica cretica TaxID=69181 RepID=A0ABQ7E6Q2_BRACR|nr:hypothetical protein DY000_02022694 [Brassica cretica]
MIASRVERPRQSHDERNTTTTGHLESSEALTLDSRATGETCTSSGLGTISGSASFGVSPVPSSLPRRNSGGSVSRPSAEVSEITKTGALFQATWVPRLGASFSAAAEGFSTGGVGSSHLSPVGPIGQVSGTRRFAAVSRSIKSALDPYGSRPAKIRASTN